MGMPGTTELLILFGIVMLVFGTGKLRNIGKDLGGAISEFKNSMKDPKGDAEKTDASAQSEAKPAAKTEEQAS